MTPPLSITPTNLVIGVCGSIAAFKAAELASHCVRIGYTVHVVMTAAAERFITPLTLQTLSRNPVIRATDSEQINWKPLHIDLADQAHVLLIAPATANIIAELAAGLASHPLTEIALATRAPIVIAPAMNGNMWLHPATQANVQTLVNRGVHFIPPAEGMLACGYEGIGRLASLEDIITALHNAYPLTYT